MELRLQQYIDSMGTLADIRNLDVVNPVVVILEHPTLGTPFTTVASLVEPSYLGVPINTTWVVLDPGSPYYRKALKLKGSESPTTSTTVDVITDGEFHTSWIEEQMYMEIFEDQQYYLLDIAQGPQGPQGPVGPAGPIGPAGAQGPAPTVDYAYVIGEILGQLAVGTVLDILGPTDVIEGLTGQYSLQLTTASGTTTVVGQVSIANPIAGVSINASNLLAVGAGSLSADQNLTLTASYVHLGQTYHATRIVILRNSIPLSISASGLPSSINEGLSSQLTVLATYSNGAVLPVTALCGYSPTNAAALSVSPTGMAMANLVSADTPVTVNITYVEGSVVRTTSLSTTVRNIIPTSLVISGPSSVAENTDVSYTATAYFSDGSQQAVTLTASFAVINPAMGAFDGVTKGLFHAGNILVDTTGNITASYTSSGATVNASKSITVLSDAVGIRPYYGVAPLSSTKNSALILSLAGRGPNTTQVATFTLNSGAPGSGITMFYAYPVSYGFAKFEDTGTPGFYGGWDGALGDPTDPAKWGPMTVQVDTGGGVIVPFYLYQTDYDGLGSVTWNASVGP